MNLHRVNDDSKEQREAQLHRADEHGENSIIPINEDFERRIFSAGFIGEDGKLLDEMLYPAATEITYLLSAGRQMSAAKYAMQLTKSLCLHFISDEHWCYFDDMYHPDYTICHMLNHFNDAYAVGKLSEDVVSYLHEAWREIASMESKYNYGIPDFEFAF